MQNVKPAKYGQQSKNGKDFEKGQIVIQRILI